MDNRGFAAAQNQVIQASNSDYVLVLNPDVVLDSNYVKNLIERMSSDPLIGSSTGCLSLASDPQIIDSAGLEMNWVSKAVERGAGQSTSRYSNDCEVFGVSGAAMYFRKMINEVSIDGQFLMRTFLHTKKT